MRIFLSHASEDKRVARQLMERLERSGLQVWLDEASLIPGARWEQQIEDAIGRSDVFICLLSPHYSSPWVRKEAAMALSRTAENPNLRIIPIFLPGTKIDDVPPALRSRVGVDLANVRDIDQALTRLVEGLATEKPWSEADSLRRLGDFDGAIQAYKSLLARYRALPDQRAVQLATILSKYAAMLRDTGQYEEALAYASEALEIFQRLAGDRPSAYGPELALALNNAAVMLRNLGRLEEALAYAGEAMELYRQLATEHEVFSRDLAIMLNNYSGILRAIGRSEDALVSATEALVILRRILGDEHPDIGTALSNSAGINRSLGRFEEAERQYREALEILGRVLGESHPAYAVCLHNLGSLVAEGGQDEEASNLYERALTLSEAIGDRAAQAATLRNLARIFARNGRLGEARSAYEKALAVYIELSDRTASADIQEQLQGLLREEGK